MLPRWPGADAAGTERVRNNRGATRWDHRDCPATIGKWFRLVPLWSVVLRSGGDLLRLFGGGMLPVTAGKMPQGETDTGQTGGQRHIRHGVGGVGAIGDGLCRGRP